VAERFGGELVVAAPARDLVLYVDGRPPGAREALAAIVADAHAKAARPLSTAILRWTAAGWVVAP
jgi:hypothetical protein